jgi:predicted transposase YbfD/YdcC
MAVCLSGGLGFPHAAQAVRITRTRRVNATTTTMAKIERETAYLIVTLPHQDADAVALNRWARQEWTIENKSHWVRDMPMREDEQRARTGTGPAVFAALRNGAIGYHRTTGATNIARATPGAARRSSALVHNLTSTGTTTQ